VCIGDAVGGPWFNQTKEELAAALTQEKRKTGALELLITNMSQKLTPVTM